MLCSLYIRSVRIFSQVFAKYMYNTNVMQFLYSVSTNSQIFAKYKYNTNVMLFLYSVSTKIFAKYKYNTNVMQILYSVSTNIQSGICQMHVLYQCHAIFIFSQHEYSVRYLPNTSVIPMLCNFYIQSARIFSQIFAKYKYNTNVLLFSHSVSTSMTTFARSEATNAIVGNS